jgi:hypothetical protein
VTPVSPAAYSPRIGDVVRVRETQMLGIVTMIGSAPMEPYFRVVHASGFARWCSASKVSYAGNAFDAFNAKP